MGAIYLNGISYAGGGSGGGDGQIIQVPELPEPSETYNNKIYQYIGITNDTYINGYFYKCIEELGIYSWKTIQVSPSGVNFSVEGNTLKITDI